MNKSYLIIDTPENCDECRLMHSYYDHDYGWIKECIGSGVNDCIVFKRKLEDYCPLKPASQLMETILDENKALRLLLRWAEECDFGYDNFPEEYERYKKDVENIDYIEGMIYIAKKIIEESNGSE